MPKIIPFVSKVYKVENKYKITPSQWRKWTFQQQKLFNYLYPFYRDNQDLMSHPKGPRMHAEHWNTVAWNTAWTATNESSRV